MKDPVVSAVIDQEIDFIGQLFVEYEQLTAYPDILSSPDKLRSLASLFYDFVERIHQALQQEHPETKKGENRFKKSDVSGRFSGIFDLDTLDILQPFFRFYREYRSRYPHLIDSGEIKILYHRFPEAAEIAAAHLRAYTQKLRR